MKKHFSNGLGAALLAAAIVVLSVPVQAADVRFNIPFSFTVNEATLPPGTYQLSTERAILTIRGFARGAMTLSNNLESREATTPKLVFHRYGDEYILRQVWTGGTSGRQLPQTRRERQLANASRRGDVATQFERILVPIL